VGVGLNISLPQADALRTAPAALEELQPSITSGAVLERVALPLVQTLRAFETLGYTAFQSRFNARDVLRDRAVVLSDGTAGTAHGTTETGALLVHTASGMNTVTSAEVSVRPAA